MAEISNKTLALLLIVAIIISLGGMLITLNRLSKLFVPPVTGFGTTGTVQLSIAETVSINFSAATMDFGPGAVDTGKAGCLVQNNYTNGSNFDNSGTALPFTNNCTADDFHGNVSNFAVQNIGNRNVTLNITGGSARTLFGVSGGNYTFNITNKPGSAACLNASSDSYWDNSEGTQTQIAWTVFKGTGAANEIAICNETGRGMPFESPNNMFYLNIRLNVPYLAYGSLSDTITLEATRHP